jgi:hypothetical protein
MASDYLSESKTPMNSSESILSSQWVNLEHCFVDSVCQHIIDSDLLSYVGLSPNSSTNDVSNLISTHFLSLPRRYALTADVCDVVEHLHMMSICTATSPAVLCTTPNGDLNRHLVVVTIVCVDRPKILSTMIMHTLDGITLSTVDADIMTTSSGLVHISYLHEVFYV